MKIVVIGGTGLIGSKMVSNLTEQGRRDERFRLRARRGTAQRGAQAGF
jgi:uncharacterized protein YbjT (DUF2867 family)